MVSSAVICNESQESARAGRRRSPALPRRNSRRRRGVKRRRLHRTREEGNDPNCGQWKMRWECCALYTKLVKRVLRPHCFQEKTEIKLGRRRRHDHRWWKCQTKHAFLGWSVGRSGHRGASQSVFFFDASLLFSSSPPCSFLRSPQPKMCRPAKTRGDQLSKPVNASINHSGGEREKRQVKKRLRGQAGTAECARLAR